MTVATILLILAFACFALATFNISVLGLNFLALGLALWVATLLLGVLAGPISATLLIVVLLLLVLAIIVIQRMPKAPPPK